MTQVLCGTKLLLLGLVLLVSVSLIPLFMCSFEASTNAKSKDGEEPRTPATTNTNRASKDLYPFQPGYWTHKYSWVPVSQSVPFHEYLRPRERTTPFKGFPKNIGQEWMMVEEKEFWSAFEVDYTLPSWMHNKTILFVGDSNDRQASRSLCWMQHLKWIYHIEPGQHQNVGSYGGCVNSTPAVHFIFIPGVSPEGPYLHPYPADFNTTKHLIDKRQRLADIDPDILYLGSVPWDAGRITEHKLTFVFEDFVKNVTNLVKVGVIYITPTPTSIEF